MNESAAHTARREPVHPQSIEECVELLRWRADMGRRSGLEGSFFALPPFTQATLFGIAGELENIADFLEGSRGPSREQEGRAGTRPSTSAAHTSPRPEILDACCGGRMWWWDKQHPLAVYMDVREAPPGSVDCRPNFEVAPDVLADFRSMPFEDGSFQLVVFDPPHLVRSTPSVSYLRTKYGALPHDTEQADLERGFAECWRVLAPGGTLVFKWADKLERVEPHFPAEPVVGTRSPRGGQTRWFIFYKPLEAALEAVA